MTFVACACCGAALQWQGDYACCDGCGLWQSRLPPQILHAAAWQQLDENARGEALQALRLHNFALVLDRLAAISGSQRGDLLDVGAAHGWFVSRARHAGYNSSGLEPDPRLARWAREHGAVVREGFFPDVLHATEQFDVLVFNDVFEHLPAPQTALQACARHLRADGLLVLNLPLASGFFFGLSIALLRVGFTPPWQRLWQTGFPSPHLFFFQSRHLERLAQAAGFTLVSESALPSLSTTGLWARLRMDRSQPLWLHVLVWPLLVLVAPLVRILPNDIGLFIFRKQQHFGG